ncbi:MAG: mechanosensitive ion channel family protein [Lachnospiraceae bacterium]|nr:mechanosensitive ion channel family protein [Lachnospiraceae bacterium]
MENSGGSIFQRLSVEINAFLKSVAPEMRDSAIAIVIIDIIIFLILYIVLFIIIMWIKSKIIARFKDKKGNSLTIQFLEKIITIALIVYFVVLPLGGDQIARSILGSTAVVAAIVGFAAQDAIKDMFAGLQISIYKPFDVGSRIAFEDGTTGVVESMTLRHVVLVMLDTTRLIIPNSKANSMKIINYSYGDTPKSVEFRFPISYDSDLQKAKDIIRKTICENPLSLNKDSYD